MTRLYIPKRTVKYQAALMHDAWGRDRPAAIAHSMQDLFNTRTLGYSFWGAVITTLVPPPPAPPASPARAEVATDVLTKAGFKVIGTQTDKNTLRILVLP